MKTQHFILNFLPLILINSIFSTKENKNFKYSPQDIENYLIPRPQKIIKGNENLIFKDISFKFYLEDFKISSKENKRGRDIYNQIIYLYSEILSNNYNPSKIFKRNIYKHSELERQKNRILQDANCNIIIKVENLEMLKFSDYYSENVQKIEYYSLKIANTTQSNKMKNKKNFVNFNIRITTQYLNGLLRGLETVSQIFIFEKYNEIYQVFNLPLQIEDFPSFAYRGIMIDTSRQYIPIEKIMEILDGMLFSKLNILHWHLTDDEYFSINFSQEDEDLNLKDKLKYFSYTKQQIKAILEYASIRGITIIPEIDHPAHTRSWQFESKNQDVSNITINQEETGILNPILNKTYEIAVKIFDKTSQFFEVYGKNNQSIGYFHLGGDEIQSSLWERDDVREFMRKNDIQNISDLENNFFNKMNMLIKMNVLNITLPSDLLKSEVSNLSFKNLIEQSKLNKFIYWVDENPSRFYDIYFDDNSVFMYWGHNENLKKFIDQFTSEELKRYNQNKNKKLIVTSGDFLYMDCGTGNKYGDGTWCGDYKTWKKIYSVELFKSYKNFEIIGSQITLFGELADENIIVSKLFPRALSISEKLWNFDYSSVVDSEKNKMMFVKIINHNKRLNNRGVNSISITSQLCENEIDLCIEKIK